MIKYKKLLWLDDYRDPFDEKAGWLRYSPVTPAKVIWVKSYKEFVKWINKHGLPDAIAFDHDLADEHYAPQDKWLEYDKWANKQEFKEKTGHDCAKWLIEYCIDNEKELPMFSSHSANPVGRENILKLLTSFLKYQSNEKK